MFKHNKKSTNKVCWPSFNKQPIPDEMWVTLSYTDRRDATSSVGAYAYVYALNDVYDPDVTGIGSQPLAYDQWVALYNRWVVLASEIEVTCTSRSVSNQLAVAVVPCSSNTLVPTSYEAAAQMRYAKIAATTGGGPSPKIVLKAKVNEVSGVPLQSVQSDDQFSGSNSASPSRRLVWGIFTETSGASDSFSLSVKIRYKVRFCQVKLADVSLTSAKSRARAKAAAAAAFTDLPDDDLTVGALLVPGDVVIPTRMEEPLEASPPELVTPARVYSSHVVEERMARLERLVSQLLLKADVD